jgi:hypothetical protein
MMSTTTLAALLAAAGLIAAPVSSGASAAIETAQQGVGSGTVVVSVFHSETGQPLAHMPVTVRTNAHQPLRRPPLTNESGTVEITGLMSGSYEALVIHNNHTSNIEPFVIVGDGRVSVALFFNPDIDG